MSEHTGIPAGQPLCHTLEIQHMQLAKLGSGASQHQGQCHETDLLKHSCLASAAVFCCRACHILQLSGLVLYVLQLFLLWHFCRLWHPTTNSHLRYTPPPLHCVPAHCSIEYNVSYVYHSLYAYFDRDNVALPGMAAFFKVGARDLQLAAQC